MHNPIKHSGKFIFRENYRRKEVFKIEFKKIAVMGAGIMGHGIAQVFAQAGFKVCMRDVDDKLVQRGLGMIRGSLKRRVERGRMTKEQADEVFSRIRGTTDLAEAVKEADVVIECVPEDMTIKKKVFRELNEVCLKHTILASNTSALSITEMASVTDRPDKCIGMHFFNPPHVMRLVEIVRGAATSDETFRIIEGISKKLDKTPVEVKDSPGFLVNRCLFLFINEAAFALMEGVAGKEEIDTSIKLGLNHPMGPLELADFIGVDTTLSIMENLYREFADPKYRPCPLLKRMVRAGWLGRKTKKGFYEYK